MIETKCYIADNGKLFKDKYACAEYEKKVAKVSEIADVIDLVSEFCQDYENCPDCPFYTETGNSSCKFRDAPPQNWDNFAKEWLNKEGKQE